LRPAPAALPLDGAVRARYLGAAVGLIAGIALAAGAFGQAQRTVRDGVFSAAQVAQGKRLFGRICADCHEIAEFTDAGAYLEQQEGKTVWEAFEYIWAEMPEDDPASLDPKQYAAVLAYALSAYGLPSGANDLPIDRKSLEAIRFAKP
jgi:mono/diheme cytochrome c family protein